MEGAGRSRGDPDVTRKLHGLETTRHGVGESIATELGLAVTIIYVISRAADIKG